MNEGRAELLMDWSRSLSPLQICLLPAISLGQRPSSLFTLLQVTEWTAELSLSLIQELPSYTDMFSPVTQKCVQEFVLVNVPIIVCIKEQYINTTCPIMCS